MRLLSELTVPLLIGIAVAAHDASRQPAEIRPAAAQLAALGSQSATPTLLTLPPVTAYPRKVEPHAPDLGPRAASVGALRVPHFRVWDGYDLDVALHPYTSRIGPCPEGSNGSGCGQPAGQVIKPSRYEQTPFTD